MHGLHSLVQSGDLARFGKFTTCMVTDDDRDKLN